MKFFFCFLLGATLFGTVAKAEEPDVKLEEVVVTASRIEEEVKDATSDVRVITREDIKKLNVQYVTDVFRTYPELHVTRNGGPGKISSVFIRGNEPQNVLVLIDGIRQNSPTTGEFNFSSITIDDIDRIEIVKGAQSALYGSDASGGVINIITKRGRGKARLDALFEAGSYDSYRASATFGGGKGTTDYRLTGGYSTTEGISAASSGSEPDGYEHVDLSGTLGIRPSNRTEFIFTGKYYYDFTELDDFLIPTGPAVDSLEFIQRRNHYILSGVGKFYVSDQWEQILTLSAVGDDLTSQDPNNIFNNYDIVTIIDAADWQHNVFVSDTATIIAGAAYRVEEAENKGSFKKSVDTGALYLSGKTKMQKAAMKFVIDAGLRYEDHETAGSKTTYKVGLLYAVDKSTLALKGNYGTGFRAPSLNQLFFPNFGNPNLKPEESTYWDIGFEKGILENKFTFSVSYFDQHYQNLIQFDSTTFTAENIANADIKGAEVNVTWNLHETFRIIGGYTYLHTEDNDTGQRLTRRPDDKVTASAHYRTKRLSLLADYRYVGDRFDKAVQRDLEPYSLVNISGDYAVNTWLTIFGRIDNLFDEEYEEAGSYGTPGFSIFGGIKLTNI